MDKPSKVHGFMELEVPRFGRFLKTIYKHFKMTHLVIFTFDKNKELVVTIEARSLYIHLKQL